MVAQDGETNWFEGLQRLDVGRGPVATMLVHRGTLNHHVPGDAGRAGEDQMVERQADSARALADIKPQVLAEYRRGAGERALRAYLDDLRARADVVAVPTPP